MVSKKKNNNQNIYEKINNKKTKHNNGVKLSTEVKVPQVLCILYTVELWL